MMNEDRDDGSLSEELPDKVFVLFESLLTGESPSSAIKRANLDGDNGSGDADLDEFLASIAESETIAMAKADEYGERAPFDDDGDEATFRGVDDRPAPDDDHRWGERLASPNERDARNEALRDLAPMSGDVADGAVERRTFVMHENLLRDVIQRQAGTLGKAVLEGVMNLIEAGATYGDVVIESDRLTITDDGHGFRTRSEILEAFEVFGKSDQRRSVAGRWAEFQMGRGQLIAHGRTTYRTRTFAMVTDIAAATTVGIGYELHGDLPDVPGCTVTVELYEPLNSWQIIEAVDHVAKMVRYVDIPISVNGARVTVDPRTESWTFEDDDAWYRVRANRESVDIYNLGVFVHASYLGGAGGTIVSKKRLRLNFARNDVIGSCPVWRRIAAAFRKRTRNALFEKKRPTATEVSRILEEWRGGRITTGQVARLPLLRDTNGRRTSPLGLIQSLHAFANDRTSRRRLSAFTFDRAGSLKADHAMQARPWLVLDAEFHEDAFRVTPMPISFDDLYDLGTLLLAIEEDPDCTRALRGSVVVRAFAARDDLYSELSFARRVLPDTDLRRDEQIVLTALRRENSEIADACEAEVRTLSIGASQDAKAWTDGAHIVIDRAFLRRCIQAKHGLLDMLLTLVHEYSHLTSDLTHDDDFHRRFHDGAMEVPEIHMRILGTVAQVAGNRLQSFAHAGVVQARGAVRISYDEELHTYDAQRVPCPACALWGVAGDWISTGGVPLGILRKMLVDQETFVRHTTPPADRNDIHDSRCPLCGGGWHNVKRMRSTSPAVVRALVENAVTAFVAGAEGRRAVGGRGRPWTDPADTAYRKRFEVLRRPSIDEGATVSETLTESIPSSGRNVLD